MLGTYPAASNGGSPAAGDYRRCAARCPSVAVYVFYRISWFSWLSARAVTFHQYLHIFTHFSSVLSKAGLSKLSEVF